MEDRNFDLATEISSKQNDVSEVLIEVSSSFNDTGEITIEIQPSLTGKDETLTEITINPNNSFKAKYSLIAVGQIQQEVEITSRVLRESDSFIEIHPRALGESNKETYLDIMYRGNSDILTEIQPIGHKNLEAEIEVRPHNRMQAIYEVQQPPIVTDVFNPNQDAFTREQSVYQSINYGTGSSMVVGRSQDDIWRSFVQFDLSSINESYVLKESYLRLYYKGTVPESIKLEILNADSSWQETNITDLNRPSPIDLISNEFAINRAKGYIEFDVLDIVKSWVALQKINNGFILRISNETEFGQATFNTRETSLPPELVVKYFDSRIFSHGRSQHTTEIFVYNADSSEVDAEITVDSVYSFSAPDAEIYVHRVEVPLDYDILTEITASKPYVPVEIVATIHVDDDVLTEIGARLPFEDKKDTEIVISKPYVFTEIYVRHNYDIETELVSRAYKESPVDAIITVSKPFVHVEITPVIHDESFIKTELSVTKPQVEVEISVPINDTSVILTEIEANEFWVSMIPTEIYITKQNVSTEITARVGKRNDLYTVIYVSRPQVEIEVEVKYRDDIWVEIEPNIKSDVLTEIAVTKPSIEVSISVQGYGKSEKDTEIYVRFNSDIETEIDAKVISQVDTVIDIKAVSQIPIEISTTKRYVNTEIVIPIWVDYDLLTEIEPRILMVDNVYAVIQIGSKGGAYAFII